MTDYTINAEDMFWVSTIVPVQRSTERGIEMGGYTISYNRLTGEYKQTEPEYYIEAYCE